MKSESFKFFSTISILISLLFACSLLKAGEDVNTDSQQKTNKEKKQGKKSTVPVLHYEITVTATRSKRDTFETPKPVSVVGKKKIKESAPNNVAELLKELPGVDVTGVGVNQVRPIIRGLRGQRILLMED